MFTIHPTTTSGDMPLDNQEFSRKTLQEAREFAHLLLTGGEAFNVYVRNEDGSVIEVHTGSKCEACKNKD